MSTNETQSLETSLQTPARNAAETGEAATSNTGNTDNTINTETDAALKSKQVSQAVKDSVDREKVLPKKSGRGGPRANSGRKKKVLTVTEPNTTGEAAAESQSRIKKRELSLPDIIDKVWSTRR
jgi:hypothetical protein